MSEASGSFQAPVMTMVRAVIVQMTIVSMNGSSSATIALGGRLLGAHRGVGDGCRAESRLVGERRALEADEQGPDRATDDTLAGEGSGEDLADGGRHRPRCCRG